MDLPPKEHTMNIIQTSRGAILRDAITQTNRRRDGALPFDVPGVAEAFEDDLALLGALQLRWHTRLAGRIERELMAQPMDLEQAVVSAWHATADELPGVLAVIDRHRAAPTSAAMAEAMTRAADKERTLLAMMAGRVSTPGDDAARIGAQIENRARATYRPVGVGGRHAGQPRLFARIKAALAA
jgi:hypothetical protein